jgi:hypothetical protein
MSRKIAQILKFHMLAGILAVLLTVMIIVVVVRSNIKPLTQRDFWKAKGISSYQMRVDTVALPSPPVGLDLTIRGGEITNQSIIACDNPSEEYPESLCDTIKRYYSWVGRYTIEQLFDTAQECIRKTQTSFAVCPAVNASEFSAFSTSEDMVNTANACRSYLQGLDSLCTVQYDSDYGYPNHISFYNPNVFDGYSTITVNDFHVIG